MLKDYLKQDVDTWQCIGAPALMQRFVLRNGKEYVPTKRIGRRGTPKNCFANAAKIIFRKAEGWNYVEGYVIHREVPFFPIQHAWVTADGRSAMDPTLNAAEYEYFGVAFDRLTLMRELARNGVYGLLDTGFSLNVQLMFELDPQLKSIVEAIKPDAYLQAQAKTKEEADQCERS